LPSMSVIILYNPNIILSSILSISFLIFSSMISLTPMIIVFDKQIKWP